MCRYAWFSPRTSGDWIGPTASLLQPDKPELTQLGTTYLQQAGEAAAVMIVSDVIVNVSSNATATAAPASALAAPSSAPALTAAVPLYLEGSWISACQTCVDDQEVLVFADSGLQSLCNNCGFQTNFTNI